MTCTDNNYLAIINNYLPQPHPQTWDKKHAITAFTVAFFPHPPAAKLLIMDISNSVEAKNLFVVVGFELGLQT